MMTNLSAGLKPALFLVSGFAATQAGAVTVTFEDYDFSKQTDVTISGGEAQFRYTPRSDGPLDALAVGDPFSSGPIFTALGSSKIGAGAKNGYIVDGVDLSTNEADYKFTQAEIDDSFDYELQIAFDVGDQRAYGIAHFGYDGLIPERGAANAVGADPLPLPVYGLRSVEYQLAGAAVPEPESWAMMAAGFGAVGVAARARRRKQALAA